MPRRATTLTSKIILAAVAFVVLAVAITTRPPKWLSDFDQSFYLTIAYDLDRHGVFSNGIFDTTDSTRAAPPPGMFFVPGYPLLVLAAMKVDARFAKAVECSVEANHNRRDGSECDVYATPDPYHPCGLARAWRCSAVSMCGDLIFGSARVFWLAGALATAGLTADADMFSFIMTESLTFALYSVVHALCGPGMEAAGHFLLCICRDFAWRPVPDAAVLRHSDPSACWSFRVAHALARQRRHAVHAGGALLRLPLPRWSSSVRGSFEITCPWANGA